MAMQENDMEPKEDKAPQVSVPPVIEEKKEEKKEKSKKKSGDESLMGTLLIVSLVICLLAATGYFGYAGYRLYRTAKTEQSIPSIDGLTIKEEPIVSAEPTPTTEAPKEEEKKSETVALDKAKTNIKILNGGAIKGSASTYVETLKKAGYTTAVFGNSFGGYKGVTLYYATGKEKEAEAIKQDIVITYPAVTVKAAPQGDKDATAATFVVILGQ